MLTTTTTAECLGRLSLLRRFPQNDFALAELGKILHECDDDAEARELVGSVLESCDDWPGPCSFRNALKDLRDKKQRAARAEQDRRDEAELWAARDKHEQACPGFTISISAENLYVAVDFCRERSFGLNLAPRLSGPVCRRGDQLRERDPQICDRVLADELAARPGWISESEYWERRFPDLRKPATAKNKLVTMSP